MKYCMFFVKVIQLVAVYPYKEVEAMSRPFQTPDVIQLRVKHAKAKICQQFACFPVENSIFYANVTRKYYYAMN